MKKIREARASTRFGRFSNLVTVLAAALVLAGCASSVQMSPQSQPTPAPAAAPQPAAPVVAPAAAEPKPTEAPKPEVVLTSPVGPKQVEVGTVFFDFDKSELKPASIATLDALVAKAKGKIVEATIVVGHTDSMGTSEYNQKLSVRRADAVKAYLISKGIDPSCVFTEGKGESAPARSNDTEEDRAMNRRAEIELVIVQ